MAEDLGRAVEQIQQMLGNEKMADTIKMIMNMLASSNKNGNEQNSSNTNTPIPIQAPVQNVPETQIMPVTVQPQAPKMNSQVDAVVKLQQVYTKLTSNDDPTISLLMALKPHLNSRRTSMLDNAIQIVRMSKLPAIISEINNR